VVAHLVIVRGAAVGDAVGGAVKDGGRGDIGDGALRLGVGERYHGAVFYEP
jgi:hypothetical protein